MKLVYAGESKVVVTKYTPIKLDYFHNTNHVKVFFYIQRYTADGFVVDAAVQLLMNQHHQDEQDISSNPSA